MNAKYLPICSCRLIAPALRLASLLAVGSSAHAVTYTWDGTANLWNTAHWDAGAGLVTFPAGNSNTNSAVINSGTVTFAGNDTFGAAATASSPIIVLNSGGTLASGGFFNAIIGLNINGGTLLSNGGVNSPYGAFALKGTVTVGGTVASTFSTGSGSFNTISIGAGGGGGTTTFDVADVTASSAPDLFANTVLNNLASVASGIVKSGAGTMQLGAVNTYTGDTVATGGVLEIASGGSVTTSSRISTNGGANLVINGTLTTPSTGIFSIGAGSNTTGTTTVEVGGILNIGTGGGYTGIGGRNATAASTTGFGTGFGNGTLTINGGQVNVAAAGAGTGTSTGLDCSSLWLNPYGGNGVQSTINLNGGVLTTSRPIQNGSPNPAAFYFNGGTLKLGATVNPVTFDPQIRNGGATIDTNGFSVTSNVAYLHSALGGDAAIDGGFTKAGAGTLTMSNAGSTYNGNVSVNAGTLLLGGVANNPNPVATSLGNMMSPGRTISIASGATLQFGSNDTIGSTTIPATGASFIVNGGTLARSNTIFTTIGNVTLNSGATMTGGNGVFTGFQSWVLRGTVTVGGTSGSTITTTGTTLTGIHLGVNGTNVFDVGATGSAVDLTVSAPLIDRPGNNVGSGVLQKTGAGTMVLGAVNEYTGTTTVTGGRLLLNGSLPAAAVVNVENGAGFGRTSAGSTTIGTLTLGSAAGHTSALTFASNSTLVIGNTNGLVASGGAGTVTVNVTGAAPAIGTYTLLDYDGTLGGGFPSFTLGTLPSRTLATLVDNSVGTSIDLSVTGVDSARWSGALGSAWSTATLAAPKNWALHSNGTTPTDYIEGDTVRFTDSAVGTTVDITGADVSPGGVIFDATQNYTLTGTHGIAGGVVLSKSGSGTLTISNVNTYSGGTAITGGIIQTASGGLGATGNISFSGGTLRYATGNTQDLSSRIANSTSAIAVDTNGNNVAFAFALAGTNSGGLTKSGAGTLTLASNASTYTGDININEGTLALTAGLLGPAPTATALGNPNVARTVTIGAGARLEFKQHDILGNDGANPALTFVVNGGTLAAVTGSQASGNGPFNTLPAVTLNGGTISAANGAFAPVQSFSLKGDITVTGSAPSFINTTGTTALLDGVHLSKAGGVTFNVADVTGDSAADLTVSVRLLNTANFPAVANGLTKSGSGTMVLSAISDYAGPTSVAAGTLLVTGSISGSDVQVESGATIGGTGTANTLWVKAGGTLSPGTGIGTFAADGGDILLEGISNFEIQKSGFTLSADLAVSTTAIVFGGTLNITASGDALAGGDTFNLFDAPDLGGNVFATINLPSLDPGLSWDTTDLTNGGTITVVPEPGTATLLLAGLGLVARRRRQQP